jgi:plastocyanin
MAACGGGGGNSDGGHPDASPDGPVVKVMALSSCPATVGATVMDSATMFIPMSSTIQAGGVVKFVITSEHFVIPNVGTTTDSALMVSRGETKCFKFNVVGTYGFACGVHGFIGTITVQ